VTGRKELKLFLQKKGQTDYFGRTLDTFITGIKGWRSSCGNYTFCSLAKVTDNEASKRMKLAKKKKKGRQ